MRIISIVLFLSAYQTSFADRDDLLDGTELVLSFLIHRHGDRTPVEKFLAFSDKPELLKELSKPYGYGQLTEAGKRRGFELGKFIRSRYDRYLSPQYNRSEIYLRSTDSTRAKMTMLVAMSAVYRPGKHAWSKEINWVPVPYTTKPFKFDWQMGINCPVFNAHFDEITSTYTPKMREYSHLIDVLSTELQCDLRTRPAAVYMVYDVLVSQINMGVPLKPSLEKLMPKIKEAAGEAMDVIFGDDSMLPMQIGLLLKEFFSVSTDAMAGNATQKVRIYSAHDTTVYALEAVSRVMPRQGVPPYASVFALELRRVKETGQYVVLPVYVKSPGEPVQYLKVEGCGGYLCDINKFYDITSRYLLDEEEWKKRCHYDRNDVFDFSILD